MNKKILDLVVGTAIVSIALTAVTASSFSSYTPLYTARMEQESSEMSFLPTEINGLTYTTESGFELNYEATAVNGENSILASGHASCIWTCFWSTCDTCSNTCPYTCEISCGGTCGGSTCWPTCSGPLCQ
jgi:hypothetical protein